MAEEGYTYMGKHMLSNLINLTPTDFEHLCNFWGFEKELNQLRRSLVSMADIVDDAVHKQLVGELHYRSTFHRRVRRWVIDLREVAYQAEDLLSDLSYETTRLKIRQHEELHSISSMSRATDIVKKGTFRLKMALKLMKVNRSLQNIQRQSLSLQLSSIQCNLEDMLSQNRLPTDSILDSPVVGRKADVARIVNLLTSSCYQQLTVVSILEMPGVGRTGIGRTCALGRTTLAKLVCQKVMALTRKPFDVYIWVSASSHNTVYKVLREMLRSLNASMGGLTNDDAVLSQLKIELERKKFLLVLDDAWLMDFMQWVRLKAMLLSICTINGNAILAPAPHEMASTMANSSEHSLEVNYLSDDECWFILKERAFRNVIKPAPSNLEAIGREIAKMCRGIPSIAQILGGVMGFNMDEEAWLEIRDRVDSMKGYSDYLLMVKLILYQLPSYLHSCLFFCSIFPKGFIIRKDELIWLWMAEGIVESCDMGNKCFDELLASSLFEDAGRDDYDDVILCKRKDIVHELVHHFSKHLSDMLTFCNRKFFTTPHSCVDDKYVSLEGGAKKLRTVTVTAGAPNQEIWQMQRLRGLHFDVSNMGLLPSSIGNMKHLRYLGVSISETKVLPESITKLYNLQTLNLSNSSIKELPEFITKLFNLQTLNLSNSNVNKLPESISKLHSLQILNVSNSNLKELPESIANLRNLQTLDVSSSDIKELPESIIQLSNLQNLKFLECKELAKLPRKRINNLISLKHIAFSYEHQMPFGLGNLNGLETLLFFVVGPDWGGSIEELEFLNELRGDLKITRLEEVDDTKAAERANLQGKANLQGICFEWSYGENDRSLRDEELLEGLQPHPNIERIKIKYYMGEKWPSWMLKIRISGDGDFFGVINNLVDLKLEWCINCIELPCLGDLPHLKFLKMNQLGKVKCVDSKFYGIDRKGSSSIGCVRLFPALISFSISHMENLTDWCSPSDGNKVVLFPCLESLSIQSCPKLTGFPMSGLSELVKLEIRDCEELRLLTARQQSFAFLTSVSIVGCSKFTYLHNWLLSDLSFKELSVRRCEWLTFIPDDLGRVIYLTSLELYYCERLRCFPEEILCQLTQLQYLSIGAFAEELDDFRYLNRIKDLPQLEELEIWGSDFFGREMSSLPNQLQHLTVLKSLKIMGFTKMEASPLPEWLTNLPSLRSITIVKQQLLPDDASPI